MRRRVGDVFLKVRDVAESLELKKDSDGFSVDVEEITIGKVKG